jgi:hypothetical protein
MNGNLIGHIQTKINSLKNEISAIKYTMNIDKITTDNDVARLNECTHKIQVLNEIIMSFHVVDADSFKK